MCDESTLKRTKVTELKKICKEKGIRGVSRLRKQDIIARIMSHVKEEPTVMETDTTIEKEPSVAGAVNTVIDGVSSSISYDCAEDIVTLYHGDCLEKMSLIEDGSVDLIVCDLPYGMTKNKWDVIIPFESLWKQYNRIIKKNGAILLFGNQPFTSLMVCSNIKMFRYSLVWEKNKFSDFLNARRKPMKTNEDICVFYKKLPTYNVQYWYSTPYTRWNKQKAVDKQTNYGKHKCNVAKSDGRRLPTTVLKFNRVERPEHPTQKPVDLLEWLIRSYSNEGDIVLDNCMGVGSTGVACKNMKRKFIGIELDDTYFEIARSKLME